jgi:hypothetical protein
LEDNVTSHFDRYRNIEEDLFYEGDNDLVGDAKKSLSVLNVYFRDIGIVKYKKDELYGFVDVIGKG